MSTKITTNLHPMFSNHGADLLEVSLTEEGIIITFFKRGDEYISIAKTYDEWIEDEQDRVQEIIESLERHPSDYVRRIGELQIIDGGGKD
jgi:hypothetical protein